jgi:hypothetical protein
MHRQKESDEIRASHCVFRKPSPREIGTIDLVSRAAQECRRRRQPKRLPAEIIRADEKYIHLVELAATRSIAQLRRYRVQGTSGAR